MIGLDTNVLVRYLAQDDDAQAAIATEVIESLSEAEPGFISLVTLVESSWVLTRAYGVDPDSLVTTLDLLLTSRELVLEHADAVRTAVDAVRDGAELSDAVIAEIGREAGCSRTVTFDRAAARRAGMSLLE